MDAAAKSIRGKIRDRDEDAICLMSDSNISEYETKERFFCALADGMGGAARGDLASRMAVSEARHIGLSMLSRDVGPEEVISSLQRIYENANQNLLSYSQRNNMPKMGTTLVCAFYDGNELYITNLGDSRLYIFNEGKVSFRTYDHSYVQILVDEGVITDEEAKMHPRKNEMMRALGFEEDPTPDIYRLKVFSGDSILLCCDGLWEALDDSVIGKALMSNLSAQDALGALINRSNEVDGTDNISGILLRPKGDITEEKALKKPTKAVVRA